MLDFLSFSAYIRQSRFLTTSRFKRSFNNDETKLEKILGRSDQRLMNSRNVFRPQTTRKNIPLQLPLMMAICVLVFSSCTTTKREKDRSHVVEISVPEQRMAVYRDGAPVKYFPISTSKFGLGDEPGSNRTPVGRFEIAEKIGKGKRAGTVFKSRKPTGEVVKPNSPGRDPIVSRILWLKGTEQSNRNAFNRYIYIHGTPEERTIGMPASYGCIRMKSEDVIDLYKTVGWGADVYVVNKPLWRPGSFTPDAALAAVTPPPSPAYSPASLPMAMPGYIPAPANRPVPQLAEKPKRSGIGIFRPRKFEPLIAGVSPSP